MQQPPTARLFDERLTRAAAEAKRSWFVVAKADGAISPAFEESMTKAIKARITKLEGDHLIMLTKPRAVADVIIDAVKSVPELQRRCLDGGGSAPGVRYASRSCERRSLDLIFVRTRSISSRKHGPPSRGVHLCRPPVQTRRRVILTVPGCILCDRRQSLQSLRFGPAPFRGKRIAENSRSLTAKNRRTTCF